MASIDQRVVQMVFDKGNFESAVKSVIATLDNLKKNLKFDKSVDEFNKINSAAQDVDLNYLANSIDTISNRFSTMGIIGTTVLANLTTSAVQAGKMMLSNITSSLIEGGKRRALNLEQAQFQIQGLGFAWEEVKKDVDYAVDGTAYGLDVAAKAAGQLLASGISVGENLKNSLRGVSGVAAMTNSSYEDIADVFITVAGNGRLMGSELTRLSARGINAAATIAKYLNVSETEVRDMTSKGKIDFQTFANAMDYAFGEHATKANETFTGALSNMKSALSRIGADFATPAYKHMRDVLNSLRLTANETRTVLAPLVTSATSGMKTVAEYLSWAFRKITEVLHSDGASGAMEGITKIIANLGTSLWNLYRDVRNILRPVAEAFREAFGGTLIDVLVRVTDGIEKFTHSLALNAKMEENLRRTFVGIFTILAAVLDIVATLIGSIAGGLSTVIVNVFGFLVDILLSVTGFLGDCVTRISDFIKYLGELEPIKQITQGVADAFAFVGSCIATAWDNLTKFLSTALDGAFEFALSLFDNAGDAFNKLGDWIGVAFTNITNFIEKMKELPIVQNTIERIAEAFSTVYDKASKVASIVKRTVVTAFEKARDVIQKFIGVFKEFIGQFVDISSVEEGIANFKNFVIDAFNNSKDLFEFTKEVLGKIVDKVKELTGVSFSKFIDNLIKLKDKIAEVVRESNTMEGIKGLFKNLADTFAGFADNTGGFLQKVKDHIYDFVNWVKTKVSGITLGEIIAAGAAGSFIAFFLSLASFISKAKVIVGSWTGFVTEFAAIPANINNILKGFSDRVAYDKVKERITAISKLVQSVALLAGALILLAGVDTEKLITSAAVLGGLVTLMVLLSKLMNGPLQNGNAISDLGPSMLQLAGGVAILALALKMIAKLDLVDLAKGVAAIAVVIGELVVASLILSRYSKGAITGSRTILALSAAIMLISGSLALLALIPLENLNKAVDAVTTLMTVLALTSVIASKADKGSVKSLIGMAASILILVLAIKALAMMDTETLIVGMGRMILVFGTMVGMFAATKLAGKYAKDAGLAALALSASLILIAEAIKILANIAPQDIVKGIGTLALVTLLFVAMSAITQLAGQYGKSAGIAILSMSASLILIAGAIAILSQISPDDLLRATVAVDSVIAMFTILVAASSLVKNSTNTIMQMGIALGVLSAALVILSLIDPANLAAATMAIDSLILCFSILVAASAVIKGANAQIIIMGVVIAALGGVLAVLAGLNPEGQLQVADALNKLLIGLSVAMLACAVVGPLCEVALLGIVVMAAVFAAIVGLISIIGAINAASGGAFKQFLEDTIPVLEAIGEGIGSFFGGIVNGFLSGAASGIERFGESLTKFMDSFMPFVEQVKTIDESALEGINTMVRMVIALAAADFMNAITNFITFGQGGGASLDMLSEQLPAFGNALSSFSDSLGNTNTDNLKKAAEAGKALAEMAAAMPKEGGWLDKLFGTVNMADFGDQLASFGGALKSFAMSVDGINGDAIRNVVEPTRSFVEMANQLPNSGGAWQDFFGTQDFGVFGRNLAAYGGALKIFGDAVANVNYSAISNAIQPTKDLVEISNSIDNIGGAVTWFTGDNDFKTFGDNLVEFGKAFVQFSMTLKLIDANALDHMPKVIDVIRGLADVSNALPQTGGLIAKFVGDQSLAALGDQLGPLARGIHDFGVNLEGTDPQILVDSVPAFDALGQIGEKLPTLGGMLGILTGQSFDMTLIGVQLPILGEGIRKFSESLDGLSVTNIQDSVPAVEALSQAITGMPGIFKTLETLVVAAVGFDAFPMIAESIAKGVSAFSSNLDGVNVSAAKKGAEASSALASAIQNMPGIWDTVKTLVTEWTGTDFEDCCRKLAAGVKAFSDSMEGVSVSKVQVGVRAIETIKEMSQNADSYSNLETIGDQLMKFGGKFRMFYDKLTGGVDVSTVSTLGSYMQNLVDVLNQFKTDNGDILEFASEFSETVRGIVDTFITIFTDNTQPMYDAAYNMFNQINIAGDAAISEANTKFSTAGSDLVNALSSGINGNGDAIGQACLYIMQWALDTINGKDAEFTTEGADLITHLATGMQSIDGEITKTVNNILLHAYNKVVEYKAKFKTVGEHLMTSLSSGISKGTSKVRNALQSALNSATDGINTESFYKIGTNSASALASGLQSKASEVNRAATNLAQAAAAATRAAAKIKSPSRVFIQIGEYMGQGLANGLSNMDYVVEHKAAKIAETAVSAMMIVAQTIDETIDNMVYEPKVTPVVDYSLLQAGLNGVDNYLGSPYGLGLANRAFGQMNANAYASLQNQNGIAQMTEMLDAKVSDLTDAVYGLYELNPEFTMYIDGKQFASTTARSMNRALGSIAKRGGIV